MPTGILVKQVDNVNNTTTPICVVNKNLEPPDINDVLETIKLLLNYIKNKRKGSRICARKGGRGKHILKVLPLQTQVLKSLSSR